MSKLLCFFTPKRHLDSSIHRIKTEFDVYGQIFICNFVDLPQQYFCTFAIDYLTDLPKYVITIHRKAETRTLYTINALNEVIKNCNNGKLITNYELDWYRYTDCLISFNPPNVSIAKYIIIDKIKT